jgi:HEPN domain-containing protein
LAAEIPAAWLERAAEDLLVADVLVEHLGRAGAEDEHALRVGALFHAQQAAEKAMKALLIAEGHAAPRTHDLGALADRCVALAPDLQSALTDVEQLSGYAVRIRYPGEDLDLNSAEVAERVGIARTCLTAVRNRLSQT